MPATSATATQEPPLTPSMVRIYRAISACVMREQLRMSGGDFPTVEYHGHSLLRPILQRLEWPTELEAPLSARDDEVITLLRALPMRDSAPTSMMELVEKFDLRVQNPTPEFEATTFYQRMSEHENLEILSRALDAHNTALIHFHCLLVAWMIQRCHYLKRLRYVNEGFVWV